MIKEFIRAESFKHAAKMGRSGYVFLAGGTQVNSAPFRKWGKPVEKVISLDSLKLSHIGQKDGHTRIRATTTLQDIADSSVVPAALRQAAQFIPGRPIRNMATIGGNVGANRRDSCIIPVLLALGATLRTGDGVEVSVETWVAEDREDLILEFDIPPVQGYCTVVKESRSHQALPVVSAAVHLVGRDGRIVEAAVYAGCIGSKVLKLTEVEEAVMKGADVEQAVMESIQPEDDILGSADFKQYLNAVKIADAVELCGKEVFA